LLSFWCKLLNSFTTLLYICVLLNLNYYEIPAIIVFVCTLFWGKRPESLQKC
jgi:hypothetical protein